jgi:hypothetical protein
VSCPGVRDRLNPIRPPIERAGFQCGDRSCAFDQHRGTVVCIECRAARRVQEFTQTDVSELWKRASRLELGTYPTRRYARSCDGFLPSLLHQGCKRSPAREGAQVRVTVRRIATRIPFSPSAPRAFQRCCHRWARAQPRFARPGSCAIILKTSDHLLTDHRRLRAGSWRRAAVDPWLPSSPAATK